MTVPNVASSVAYLGTRGLSRHAVTAIVSVLWVESKLDPGGQGTQSSERGGALNPSGAYGIASWNGPRQEHLQAFATKHSLDVALLETQLHFVLTEMANSYPPSWKSINSNDAYAQIIPVIVSNYENPANSAKEIASALDFANVLYDHVPDVSTVTKPAKDISIMPTIESVIIQYAPQLFEALLRAVLSTHGVTLPAPGAVPMSGAIDPAAIAKQIITTLEAIQAAKAAPHA